MSHASSKQERGILLLSKCSGSYVSLVIQCLSDGQVQLLGLSESGRHNFNAKGFGLSWF